MKLRHSSSLIAISALMAIFPAETSAQIKRGSTSQITVGVNNQVPDGASGDPVASPNGRYLAFDSTASNLVSSDGNSSSDVFLKDQETAAVTLVSVNTAGVAGNGSSQRPAISPVGPDGFVAVAFESNATNLSSFTDSQGNRDIFVRIPSIGLTEAVSVGEGPSFGNGDSFNPSVTMVPGPNRVLVVFSPR